MERRGANIFIAVCIIFATSNLMGNAFPTTSLQQWAFMQQSSAIDQITGALNVSCKRTQLLPFYDTVLL